MRLIPARLGRISRRLLRAPGFTLVAVITLALGIGANTAIFSVVRGVLLKPLHFADSGSLVGVWHSAPGIGIRQVEQSPATYFTYREEGRAFEDIGLWGAEPVSITGAGDPERVQALLVTDGILSVLRGLPTNIAVEPNGLTANTRNTKETKNTKKTLSRCAAFGGRRL